MIPKPAKSSKTIRFGAFYISIGVLIGVLQAFDILEIVLASIGTENISPDIAAWGGLVLAIIGGIQVWLRMVTSQPIGNQSND